MATGGDFALVYSVWFCCVYCFSYDKFYQPFMYHILSQDSLPLRVQMLYFRVEVMRPRFVLKILKVHAEIAVDIKVQDRLSYIHNRRLLWIWHIWRHETWGRFLESRTLGRRGRARPRMTCGHVSMPAYLGDRTLGRRGRARLRMTRRHVSMPPCLRVEPKIRGRARP